MAGPAYQTEERHDHSTQRRHTGDPVLPVHLPFGKIRQAVDRIPNNVIINMMILKILFNPGQVLCDKIGIKTPDGQFIFRTFINMSYYLHHAAWLGWYIGKNI